MQRDRTSGGRIAGGHKLDLKKAELGKREAVCLRGCNPQVSLQPRLADVC